MNVVGYQDKEFAKQNKSWLRGAAWLIGEDQVGWEGLIKKMKDWFISVRERGLAKESFAWDCAKASIEKGTWENYQAMITADDFHFGLCHGDFHDAVGNPPSSRCMFSLLRQQIQRGRQD